MSNFTIQDTRKRGWFWAHNVVIDDYLPRIGETAFAVYMVLCRAANNDTDRALISLPKIAVRIGKSARTVMRAIDALEAAGMIKVISNRRADGLNETNVYELLDLPSKPQNGLEQMTPVSLGSDMDGTRVVTPMSPSQDSLIKTHNLNIIAEEMPTAFPRAPEPEPEPQSLPILPTGYGWYTSTISEETMTHVLKGERGKPLCGASIKHRTSEPLKLAGKTPCPLCLQAVAKPKQAAPPPEVKDFLAVFFFGGTQGLLPVSWKRLVRAWNQLGCPDLPACQRLENAWYVYDWRGQKRQRPTPEQIVQVRDAILASQTIHSLAATRQPDYGKTFFTPMTPAEEEQLRRDSLAEMERLKPSFMTDLGKDGKKL